MLRSLLRDMKSFKEYLNNDRLSYVGNTILKIYKQYNNNGYVQIYLDALDKMKQYGLISDYNVSNNTVTSTQIKKSNREQIRTRIKAFAEDVFKQWQNITQESNGDSWYKQHERQAYHDILTILERAKFIKDFNLINGIQYYEID